MVVIITAIFPIYFSKVAAAGLVHNGGKRKGAVCSYLETWHLDIEEFLELRKNTGDDRRRTHDMNTANWVPDLLMKRVMEGGDWTLFSPSTCPRPGRMPTIRRSTSPSLPMRTILPRLSTIPWSAMLSAYMKPEHAALTSNAMHPFAPKRVCTRQAVDGNMWSGVTVQTMIALISGS